MFTSNLRSKEWCKSEILLLISNNRYRSEYHQTFDSLPSAMDGMNSYCDTCASKGKNSMTAKVFCTECKRKYCAKHEEVRGHYKNPLAGGHTAYCHIRSFFSRIFIILHECYEEIVKSHSIRLLLSDLNSLWSLV